MTHVLDNPVWAALNGPQAHLGEIQGQAARYHPDVAGFVTLRPNPDARAWEDLLAVAEPGAEIALTSTDALPPPGWEVTFAIPGVQLVDVALRAEPDPQAVPLGPADVPEILDLVARTEPGPFRKRTIELGTYLGIRRNGRLIAMAGERLHPPGWTEISAVCTDPAYRGQGLATRLVRAVAAGIRARGETPFLHAAADNTPAIRLYEHLGFTLRRTTTFRTIRIPPLTGQVSTP
ncbi:GNAT family N-acetyltransferase [Phytohabitans kaempferiae]|uniref:GNAT family N-acetyltransferase n=1 Tax=Phytohabitans kaempferiae TaxID=1620943 RepID=A0ABV6MA05_9ACTN